MSGPAAIWLVLLAAAVAANLPFANDRVGVFGPRLAWRKHAALRLAELLLACSLTIGLGRLLEARMGQTQAQG